MTVKMFCWHIRQHYIHMDEIIHLFFICLCLASIHLSSWFLRDFLSTVSQFTHFCTYTQQTPTVIIKMVHIYNRLWCCDTITSMLRWLQNVCKLSTVPLGFSFFLGRWKREWVLFEYWIWNTINTLHVFGLASRTVNNIWCKNNVNKSLEMWNMAWQRAEQNVSFVWGEIKWDYLKHCCITTMAKQWEKKRSFN